MTIRVFILLLALGGGLAAPSGPTHPTGTPTTHHEPDEGPPRGHHEGQTHATGLAHATTPRTDLRWIGARTTCTWIGSAEEQLHRLRLQGLGAEPTWLAVLHRVQHRNEPGYHRWVSGFLKQLRRHFGRELNSHLRHRSLVEEEIQWAAQVEFTAYQDFLHYVRGRRDMVQCIPHLSSDEVILATRPMQHGPPSGPYGIFHANWVDGATGEWGSYEDIDPALLDPTTSMDATRAGLADDGMREIPGASCSARGSQIPEQRVEGEEATSLFQLPVSLEARWHRLVEQLHDWVEEGLAAGLAVRMARHAAEQVEDRDFMTWVEAPLRTLGAGIPFSDGPSSELTPLRMRAWASEIVECLVLCFRTERPQGLAPEPPADEMSLMDRERRTRNARRRHRDSRSPRREARPTCARSSHQGPTMSRAERIAARQAGGTRSTRGSARDDSEYVEVHLEEAPRPEEEARDSGLSGSAPAAGGYGGSRPSRANTSGPTSGASSPSARPVGNASGSGDVTLPHPRRPMTLTQGVDLWRYLLFSRTALGPELEAGSRVPNGWLPASMVREICRTHESMSATNRGISTLALMTVIRFLAQELAQTIQHAETIARSKEVGRRHGEPEEDDEELLLQVSMDVSYEPVVDEVVMMQGFFFATDGRDSVQQRWARDLLRLQKELVGQRKDRRRANVQGLLASLRAAPNGPMHSEWGEQLQALLLVLLEDTAEVEASTEHDWGWLQPWIAELGTFVQGMQMWSSPILVDSQPRTTSSGEGSCAVPDEDREIEDLLRDEEEVKEMKRREEQQEAQRQADHERLCEVEAANLRAEAEAYRAWEDRQIQRYMAESTPASVSKKRCILQVELATGSGDRPIRRQTLGAGGARKWLGVRGDHTGSNGAGP